MLSTYHEALEYLENRKPQNFEKLFQGDKSLIRVKKLLETLGNPQEKLKVIHVAGTSGKGSTVYYLAKILESCGFKVGSSVSPHIYDFLERFQINSLDLSQVKFLSYVNELMPTIEQLEAQIEEVFTFYELVTILAFYIFEKEAVNYAIIETGLGGLLDATNVVLNPTKINVLTTIDFDHTEILGKKLSEIAAQKAGIIQENQVVFSIEQSIPAKETIEKKCLQSSSKLYFVNEGTKGDLNYNHVKTNEFGTKFNVKINGEWINDIILGQIGDFQAGNCTLALSVCAYLRIRDNFKIDFEQIKPTLRKLTIPGRFEKLKYQDRDLVLDMAHNPHKIKGLVNILQKISPRQSYNVIFATAHSKDSLAMLKILQPVTEELILTRYAGQSADTSKISQEINKLEEIAKSIVAFDQDKIHINQSLSGSLSLAISKNSKPILVVGSAFLVKEVKELCE